MRAKSTSCAVGRPIGSWQKSMPRRCFLHPFDGVASNGIELQAPWWKPTWNPHNHVLTMYLLWNRTKIEWRRPCRIKETNRTDHTHRKLKNINQTPPTRNLPQTTPRTHKDCHAQFSADLNMPNVAQTTVRRTRTERHCAHTSSPLNTRRTWTETRRNTIHHRGTGVV